MDYNFIFDNINFQVLNFVLYLFVNEFYYGCKKIGECLIQDNVYLQSEYNL